MKLNEIISRFESGNLAIDIEVERNPDIWQECEELGNILDALSSVHPHAAGETWTEYIASRLEIWEYIICNIRNGVVHGTATDRVPANADVISAKKIIEAADEDSVAFEDFESILSYGGE